MSSPQQGEKEDRRREENNVLTARGVSAGMSNLNGAHSEKAESGMTRRAVDSGGIGFIFWVCHWVQYPDLCVLRERRDVHVKDVEQLALILYILEKGQQSSF